MRQPSISAASSRSGITFLLSFFLCFLCSFFLSFKPSLCIMLSFVIALSSYFRSTVMIGCLRSYGDILKVQFVTMINCLDVIQMIIYEEQSKSSRFRFLSLRNTFSLVFLSLVFFVLLSVFLIVLSLETEANLAMAQLLIPFAHKHYSLCHLTFASFYLNLGGSIKYCPWYSRTINVS